MAETSSANVFWIRQGTLYTPAPDTGLLPGTTRSLLIDLCRQIDVSCLEVPADLSELLRAEAIFLTQSVLEIIRVHKLNEVLFGDHSLLQRLRTAFREAIKMEISEG